MNSKGSEWNKWDLHFHTPSSYDYKDKTVTNIDIINEMKRNSIAVFAITDHHVIDIDRYNDLRELGEKEGITVLPGIEFLSDAKGKEPVHFIGIFSEDSNIEHIWGQIKHKTDINKVALDGLRENQIYCHLKDTIALVKELGGIVTIHAGDKSGSVENITHSLPHGIAQKTEIAKAVDIYELGKESDQNGYLKSVFPNVGRVIPMIICSDNHNIRKYQIKQNLWIKGEPSFKGLKYALNEPEGRFYIGDEPDILKRVRENSTKYIKSLNIRRTGKQDANSIWFESVCIPVNSELVTVIGHKGSGKSALSDILAVCTDAEHSNDYIFLHKQKFKKKGLADRFSAFVEFESGKKTEERLLTHIVDESQERLVRYLPQSYFEKVCNEIDKVDAFRSEIEKVVFQYVPAEKKMGKATFEELIDLKKRSAETEIHHIHEEILALNDKIIKLEDQLDPNFRKNIVSKIKVKEDELSAHESLKPTAVEDPSKHAESEDTKAKKKALESLEASKLKIEEDIETITKRVSNRNFWIVEAENLNRDLKNKYNEILSVISEGNGVADKCGFDISNVIRVEFDESVIVANLLQLKEKNKDDAKLIKVEDNWDQKQYETLSPASKLEYLKTRIKDIHSEFTGEQKAFQDYLRALEEWQARKIEIEGDAETAESLMYMMKKLQYIDDKLEADINEMRDLRVKKSIEIFSKKKEIQTFYEEIKEEISSKLSQSDVSGLSIASSFYCSNEFKSNILRNIKQNRVGSFYGSEDGSVLLQEELIAPTNWNEEKSVETFLRHLVEYLECDKRPGSKNERIFIGEVVKNRKELYSYVYGLSFIDPYYDLRQKGKSLEQLSPGEKGALLLVFYLVLDKEDVPLIIDQPEDNLDNNSVAKVLVPYIREAKRYRQIIMITHNPNLAVVADADQVIKVSVNKEYGNEFSFISGGIEHPKINQQIVEVLEGTMPAFSSRKNKYQIL